MSLNLMIFNCKDKTIQPHFLEQKGVGGFMMGRNIKDWKLNIMDWKTGKVILHHFEDCDSMVIQRKVDQDCILLMLGHGDETK